MLGSIFKIVLKNMFSRSVGCISTAAICFLLLAITQPAALRAHGQSIQSGGRWRDTTGNLINAHGAGFVQVGNSYYWFGENDDSRGGFNGINCYSSTDLTNWNFVNTVLTPQPSGDLTQGRLIERPKVLYNASTNQYVMWMHVYSNSSVGYATSSTVCGNYTYQGSTQPLGNSSFDIGSFQDTDGTAYLLSANYNHGLIVYKMAADYLSAVSVIDPNTTWGDREAPTMFKVGNTYFMICSYQSGWSANDNQYSYATNIAGPWSKLTDLATPGTNTWTSQSTWVQPVVGTNGTTYIYMGDRWTYGAIDQSPYVWLPLTVSGNTLSLPWVNSWQLNVSAGTWTSTALPYLYKNQNRQWVNLNSGLCIDQEALTSGTVAQGQYCDAGDGLESWSTSQNSSLYYIASGNNSYLLGDQYSSSNTGNPIDTSAPNGSAAQAWKFTNNGQNNYILSNSYSGMCLGVTGAALLPGAKIVQGTCDGSTNEMWYQR